MLRTWTSPQLRRERRDLKTALRGDWDRSFRAADIALKISDDRNEPLSPYMENEGSDE